VLGVITMRNVLLRTALWASAGFLVALGWGLYFASTNKDIPIDAIIDALAMLTQPTAAVILHIRPSLPLGLFTVAVANAVTYALLGLSAEMIRQHYRTIHIST
jgi:hypothetical protein